MLKKKGDDYLIEVDQIIFNIYSFIHVSDLVDELKKLNTLNRFILANYIVETYCSDDDKISDILCFNLKELNLELDILDEYEDNGRVTNSYYDNLIKEFKEFDKDFSLNLLKLSYQDEIIPELPREEALILLREKKLNELFSK